MAIASTMNNSIRCFYCLLKLNCWRTTNKEKPAHKPSNRAEAACGEALLYRIGNVSITQLISKPTVNLEYLSARLVAS